MATGFQTYKEINNCCNSEIYRSECLVVGGEKEGEVKFAVPDSSRVLCGTLSTGKIDFPQRSITYIFRLEQWYDNGIFFTQIGIPYLLYQILTTYFLIS